MNKWTRRAGTLHEGKWSDSMNTGERGRGSSQIKTKNKNRQEFDKNIVFEMKKMIFFKRKTRVR